MSDHNPSRVYLITPSDGSDLPLIASSLRIDSPGVIVYIPEGNTTSVTMNVVAGEILPYRVKRVLATGTTASIIHGASG